MRVHGSVVFLEQVEAALLSLNGVQHAVVIDAHVDGEGSFIKAVIESSSLRVADVERWCRVHLPDAQRPDVVEVLPQLPRSPAGKILQKYMR